MNHSPYLASVMVGLIYSESSTCTENALTAFKDELKNLGHFPTIYESIDNLKYQLKMQLQIDVEIGVDHSM